MAANAGETKVKLWEGICYPENMLVDGAREKVGEMGELSREMDEWSLLDEVGDMRGARRELDGHEAPARPIDNQVL